MSAIPRYRLNGDDATELFKIKTMEAIDTEHQHQPDAPHRHDYYTLLWSYTATGQHVVDFKSYPILPGSLFFVQPGQVHQVITAEKPTGIAVLFTEEFLMQNSIDAAFISDLNLFKDCEDIAPLLLQPHENPRLLSFVDLLFDYAACQQKWALEAAGAVLKLFLIECVNASESAAQDNQQISARTGIIRQFKALVETRHKEWHKVAEYADKMHITPNYLNEVISESIGVSAKQYILNRIVLEAKREAVFSDLSAKEIGYKLGFNDPSHFAKIFKQHSGMNLLDFKAKVQHL